jgi:hypothetical protein
MDSGGTNNGGINLAVPQAFTVHITNINDAPVLAAAATWPLAVTNGNTATYLLRVSDVETPAASLVLSVNSTNNVVVPPAAILVQDNGDQRLVTVTPPPGQRGKTLLTFTLTDADGATASKSALLTVK